MNSKSFPFFGASTCVSLLFLSSTFPYALTKEKKHRHLNSQGLSSQLSFQLLSQSNHPLPYPTCFIQTLSYVRDRNPIKLDFKKCISLCTWNFQDFNIAVLRFSDYQSRDFFCHILTLFPLIWLNFRVGYPQVVICYIHNSPGR